MHKENFEQNGAEKIRSINPANIDLIYSLQKTLIDKEKLDDVYKEAQEAISRIKNVDVLKNIEKDLLKGMSEELKQSFSRPDVTGVDPRLDAQTDIISGLVVDIDNRVREIEEREEAVA